MQKMNYIWQNGELVAWEDATTHVLSHSLHYGSSAFEGVRVYKTTSTPAIFRLNEHVKRLIYSSKAVGMDLPYNESEIIEAIKSTVQANKLTQGYIRPLVYYGYENLRLVPLGNPIEFIIACWELGKYLPEPSVDVKVSEYIRVHPQTSITDAKIAGNYLNGVLASLAIKDTHYHEALFLDSDEFITEGAGENFFLVKDNKIYTPKLGNIVAGITRATIAEIAREFSLQFIESNLSLDDAYAADEAFFSGTAAEITAIKSINDKKIGNKPIGDITQKINDKYFSIVKGEDSNYHKHLTFLD